MDRVPKQGQEAGEKRQHLRDRILQPRDLLTLRPPPPLVDGLLYRDTLAQLSGPPGTYKSFVTVGMACAVAAGVPSWEGHRVPRQLRVLYVAAEGGNGIGRRIAAWCESNRVSIDCLHLDTYPEPLQLGDPLQVAELRELAAERRYGLVVYDTRARCTVGLEENSATDQGRAIDNAEEIRRASGGTALVVHHSGLSGDRGRGSTAWDGAVWSDLHFDGGDLRASIYVKKHKEAPDDVTHRYRLLPYVVSQDLLPPAAVFEPEEIVTAAEYERRRATLVAVQAGLDVPEVDDRRSTRDVLDIIRTLAGPDGFTAPQVVGFGAERNLGRSTVYEALKVLVRQGALRNVGTEKRPRYVPCEDPLLDEAAA